MRKHKASVWLVNTGWGGGPYGVGKRINLKNTRAIGDAIHSGARASAKTQRDPIFGFEIVTDCSGVPVEILRPRDSWADKSAYDATAKSLPASLTRTSRPTPQVRRPCERRGARGMKNWTRTGAWFGDAAVR